MSRGGCCRRLAAGLAVAVVVMFWSPLGSRLTCRGSGAWRRGEKWMLGREGSVGRRV